MTKFNITVSPDFKPDKIAGWYIFNTWFQKATGLDLHLELYDSFDAQREAIRAGKVDLIYANPFDAAMLVNEFGFQALVKPVGKNDECVVVVAADSNINCVEDLQEGTTIVTTDDPDINMIGMRLLEPANLDAGNTANETVVSYVVVAKRIMNGEAQVGFFLKEAYEEMSGMVRSKLKVLVTSEISVIYHALMVGPQLAGQKDSIRAALLGMNDDAKGQEILKGLGLKGWEVMTDEDAAFMIDLMETLRD